MSIKKPAHKLSTYSRWKKKARKFHQFTNQRTVNLTKYDKAAITKAYKKLDSHIKAVEEGRAVFVKATPIQLRNIKKMDQYILTNKGFFVYGMGIKGVKVKGKGRNTKIVVRKAQRREEYYSVYPRFNNIVELINWIWKVVKPYRIRVAFNQYTASFARSKRVWTQFYSEMLATLEQQILDKGYESPFHGAFAIWDL